MVVEERSLRNRIDSAFGGSSQITFPSSYCWGYYIQTRKYFSFPPPPPRMKATHKRGKEKVVSRERGGIQSSS